jgi:diguanylate cyclase (GGDEF)-like protein
VPEACAACGSQVYKAFKLDSVLAGVPIIFVSSHKNAELQAKAPKLGAVEFISKRPQAAVVLARLRIYQRLKMLSDTLQNAARMDFLTGTVSRHQLQKALSQEWRRALRTAAPLALLLADIEGFTAYNAEFGEEMGDVCLKSVADALRLVAHRPADVLGRYAGGRFALLLPETGVKGASTVAQRAIDAVEALQIQHAVSTGRSRITLSVGGGRGDFSGDSSAQTPLTGAVAENLIAAAEWALTEARAGGGHGARFVDVVAAGR